jgi:hypothetical protein
MSDQVEETTKYQPERTPNVCGCFCHYSGVMSFCECECTRKPGHIAPQTKVEALMARDRDALAARLRKAEEEATAARAAQK